MSSTLIKVCGVKSRDIAACVAESGADLMGMIFAPSKRRVTLDEAEEILSGLDRQPKIVGVFVNESPQRMNEIADRLQLDFVQLSGDEPAETQCLVNRPVIRALRLSAGSALPDARRAAERYFDCSSPAVALLIDAHVPGRYGGTGVESDWELARNLANEYPVILAGGLRPESVGEAVRTVRPSGVDVSTGVETNGQKSAVKIRQFVSQVRRFDNTREQHSALSDGIRTYG